MFNLVNSQPKNQSLFMIVWLSLLEICLMPFFYTEDHGGRVSG